MLKYHYKTSSPNSLPSSLQNLNSLCTRKVPSILIINANVHINIRVIANPKFAVRARIQSKDNSKNWKNLHFKPDLGQHNPASALLIIMKFWSLFHQAIISNCEKYQKKLSEMCFLGGPKDIRFDIKLKSWFGAIFEPSYFGLQLSIMINHSLIML